MRSDERDDHDGPAEDTDTTADRRGGYFAADADGGADPADTRVIATPAVPVAPPTDSAGTEDTWRRPTREHDVPEHDAREHDTQGRPTDPGDAVLAGATLARPRSRAAGHAWSLLGTLLLTPLAWYLVADAGARLTLGAQTPWETGSLNVAALLELAAGLAVAAVVVLLARLSSLGATVIGAVVLVVGLAFVVVPALTRDLLDPVLAWLRDAHAMGANTAHHLVADGTTGRLALYGLVLVLLGVVAHGVRRLGRDEERARAEHERRTSDAAA